MLCCSSSGELNDLSAAGAVGPQRWTCSRSPPSMSRSALRPALARRAAIRGTAATEHCSEAGSPLLRLLPRRANGQTRPKPEVRIAKVPAPKLPVALDSTIAKTLSRGTAAPPAGAGRRIVRPAKQATSRSSRSDSSQMASSNTGAAQVVLRDRQVVRDSIPLRCAETHSHGAIRGSPSNFSRVQRGSVCQSQSRDPAKTSARIQRE